MIDDAELLRRYDQDNSEEAFAELVRRHLDFVYAAALRRLGGDTHQAADVAQTVFVKLARQAGPLSKRRVLAGWLHTASRNAAVDVVRAENRRRTREHAAMDLKPDPAGAVEWEQLRPALDVALDGLAAADREAVLLRFFEGRRFGDIGLLLGLTEDNARRRVDRALEKLRDQLARRGVTSTAAALATALTTQAAVAAPAGFATAVTSTALAAGGTAVAATTFMSLTKLQLGIASALMLAGGGLVLHQAQANAHLREELAVLPAAAPVEERERQRAANRGLVKAEEEARTLSVGEIEWDRLSAEAAALEVRQAENARQVRAAAVKAQTRRASEAFPINELDQPPRAGRRGPPLYPFALREANISGSVVVEMIIDDTGRVTDAKIVESTHPGFESPTLEAVKQWQFTPGWKDGRAVSTKGTQKLEYNLSDFSGESPPPPAPDWF